MNKDIVHVLESGLLVNECMEKGCKAINTVHCRLLDPDTNDKYIDYWYCPEHCFKNGFCWGCGGFWGGVEVFDCANPSHLCPNCHDEIDDEYTPDDDDPYLYPFEVDAI